MGASLLPLHATSRTSVANSDFVYYAPSSLMSRQVNITSHDARQSQTPSDGLSLGISATLKSGTIRNSDM